MTNKEFLHIVDFLFCIAEPIIELLDPVKKVGRRRTPNRDAFEVILRKFYTGIQWRMIDDATSKVKGSTAFNIYQRWVELQIFDLLYAISCSIFNEFVGFDFTWQSVDATKCQAPVRNIGYNKEGLGHNPTDRGFKGTKISAQFDANGYPIGFTIAGANVHDMKLLEKTIQEARKKALYLLDDKNLKMNLCLDKGYYGNPAEIIAFVYGYESHIQSRGEEKKKIEEGFKPKRWVAERGFAWMKGCRSVRTRYCQKYENFQSVVSISCSTILMRRIIQVTPTDKLRAALSPQKILDTCQGTPTWHGVTL